MVVGELFLSAIFQALVQELASQAFKALARRERVENHFNKLTLNLRLIKSVLDDAEEKQLTVNSVKEWLEALRDIAYDLEDILDEFKTRNPTQDPESIKEHKLNVVLNLIRSIFMPRTTMFNKSMMKKIKEINSRLQDIGNHRVQLNLKECSGGFGDRSSFTSVPSTSLVDDSVYGRDKDKDSIIKMLLGSNDNISIIAVVGMGGIGKTTLAQLVYNDQIVKKNFDLMVWVHVSEEFNVLRITKIIYEAVTRLETCSMDLNFLRETLQEKLAKSKFLIVLDDVWNEDYHLWYDLCIPFRKGRAGSRIIVTTRSKAVASLVSSRDLKLVHHVKLLDDQDCLNLLTRHAGTNDAEFEDVSVKLAKKCKGLPLAAMALGGLLHSKYTKEEWENVLHSKIWDLPTIKGVLPVLRLSYYHLPLHLKRLFTYTSIFPKDYEFDRTELVHLWMAEGFLEGKENMGFEYFDELLSRSFFQHSNDNVSTFVMHDLINELAQLVAGKICYRLDEKIDAELKCMIPEEARHCSFLRHEYEVFERLKDFYRAKGLRTFLPMPVQISQVSAPYYLSNRILVELVPELCNLRVISLSGYSITEIPSSICDLIHLRYLNLSGTSIVTLPVSLGKLANLQTLSIRNCRFISKLPASLGNLSNLRHFDNLGTDQLKGMPIEIGQLKSLQVLPKIVLIKRMCLGLTELGNLDCLRGSLAIFELQNVCDIEEVKKAKLRSKDLLDDLHLAWGTDIDDSSDKRNESSVIEQLRPHVNLGSLKVEFYRELKFPAWIGNHSYTKLSRITIINCLQCEELPSLGQLPGLKHLRLGNLPNIWRIGEEFYGNGTDRKFPNLETLRFDDMPEWREWLGVGIKFTHLKELAVTKCGKLTVIPPLVFPVLSKLDLEECNGLLLRSFSSLDHLTYLKIEAASGLLHLPIEFTKSLAALEVLECCNCNEMLSLWLEEIEPGDLTCLQRIVIADCSQFMFLGQGDRQFPCNLEVLELFHCPGLMFLPSDLSSLGSLRELIIKNCTRFITFPDNGIPSSLKRLEILSCNALELLPSNISCLERLEIKDCSSLRKWRLPVALKKLAIQNCSHLEPIPDNMLPENERILLEDLSLSNWSNFKYIGHHLHGLQHLVKLHLSRCYSIKHFPEQGLPPSLRSLTIEDCTRIKSLPSNMNSLLSLEIQSCSSLLSFPNFDLPPNLTSLRVLDSKKLKPLKQWGLDTLSSLKEFSICGGFKDLEQLCDDGSFLFPPSLIRCSIARFPKLASLAKVLENLRLLRYLSITNCNKIAILPSEEVLAKLWHLEISDCEVLKDKCMRDGGEHWDKIAGIPCVEIDGTYVYKKT